MRPPLTETRNEHQALSRTFLLSASVAIAAAGLNAAVSAWLGGLFAVGGMLVVSLFYLAMAVFHRSLASPSTLPLRPAPRLHNSQTMTGMEASRPATHGSDPLRGRT